jgi:hypothetical protein
MKNLFCIIALFLSSSQFTQAQVQFDSGNASMKGPITTKLNAAHTPYVKQKRIAVLCRNGKKTYSRQNVCTGHGGPANP